MSEGPKIDEEHLKYSSRPCPRCGQIRLRRMHRPLPLRLLRLAGMDYRRYRCSACGKVSTLRRRS